MGIVLNREIMGMGNHLKNLYCDLYLKNGEGFLLSFLLLCLAGFALFRCAEKASFSSLQKRVQFTFDKGETKKIYINIYKKKMKI